MKSQVTQEFKNLVLNDVLQTPIGSTVVWESPRLTTMYPRPGAPKGSDRAICRVINGVLQVQVLDKNLLLGDYTGVSVTAGLWGEYNKAKGVIASTKYYLDGQYADSPIQPLLSYDYLGLQGYGVSLLNSNGGLGFNAWNSFSNQAQNIYIRLAFVREAPQTKQTVPIPIKVVCSGALIAADPS